MEASTVERDSEGSFGGRFTGSTELARNALGLPQILFCIVTGSAPLAAMMFNDPLSGLGIGISVPAAFWLAGISFTLFSVGYVEMARRKTTAGGFYSYTTYGFGRVIGLGTAIGIAFAYLLFAVGVNGVTTYFANTSLKDLFSISMDWRIYCFGFLLILLVITYFHIEIVARILGICLLAELVILFTFSFTVLFKGGGPDGIMFSALNPAGIFGGGVGVKGAAAVFGASAAGVGFFGAYWSWVGFEMAPNYAEESRDPKRIVPRALYISVIGLGILYTLTSWAPFSGYPSLHAAAAQAVSNPAQYYLSPANAIGGRWLGSILSYLIITGSFACGMAFHNTTARYFYSLGREGLLPRALGRTHPRWKSPHIASVTQSVIAALIVLGFALFTGTNDPAKQAYIQLYGLMAVMGVIVILSVQALVSLSILIYFQRHHEDEVHWWRTIIAPALAFISQGYVVYLLFNNIEFLGSGYGYAHWLGPIDLFVVLVGVGAAVYLRRRRPAKYERAGRLINEGL
jgi:amino acid transporter